jgi:hypothetical protein
MSITTVTHINLRGEAREALKFYQSVFWGTWSSSPTGTPTTCLTLRTPRRSCGARSSPRTASM